MNNSKCLKCIHYMIVDVFIDIPEAGYNYGDKLHKCSRNNVHLSINKQIDRLNDFVENCNNYRVKNGLSWVFHYELTEQRLPVININDDIKSHLCNIYDFKNLIEYSLSDEENLRLEIIRERKRCKSISKEAE